MPGLLFGRDWRDLTASVDRVMARVTNRIPAFAEIGVELGRTSADVVARLAATGRPFVYYGIDVLEQKFHHDSYIYIRQPSHLAVDRVLPPLDWVFVDGCHCAMCCRRDADLYGHLIAPGGEILFHDASPGTQGLDPQNYGGMDGYHDADEARGGIAVRKAIDSGLPASWRLISAAPDQPRGGIEIYEVL